MTPGEERTGRDADQPMLYQIRLKGHLTSHWMGWFDGLTITLEADGSTLLNGPVIDQAALHGILKKIRDLGLPLLSVNSIDLSQAITADTDPGEGDA
jgi:hypothetical protein